MAGLSKYDLIKNRRIRIGLDTKKINLKILLNIFGGDFNYDITNDENYIYFTIKDSFQIFSELTDILGHNYTEYLTLLVFESNAYKTSTNFSYLYKDNKLTFSFLTYPENYYISEDGSLSIGELMWENANYVDPDYKMYGIISEYLLCLCYADIITDEDTIKTIVDVNYPF